jgi:rubrerythrin
MEENLLDFALKFEAESVKLYLSLAARTTNFLGKRLFYALAKQEVEHAESFDEIYREIAMKPTAVKLALPSSSADIEQDIRQFFVGAGGMDFRSDAGNISAYELALQTEEKGYASYKKFLVSAEKPEEKEFLQSLMDQERKHMEAIRNVLAYITGTGDWFESEESKIWNWMNQ